jgi:hypothetical protein
VEAKEKDEWQYWQADLLMAQGRKEEGTSARARAPSPAPAPRYCPPPEPDPPAADTRRPAATWIARLPVEAKEKDEWQYWQADLLMAQGRKEEAGCISLRRISSASSLRPCAISKSACQYCHSSFSLASLQ